MCGRRCEMKQKNVQKDNVNGTGNLVVEKIVESKKGGIFVLAMVLLRHWKVCPSVCCLHYDCKSRILLRLTVRSITCHFH